MRKDEPARIPGVITLIAPLAGAALGFNAKVHGRDDRNFCRHLCRIAARRGWYPHDCGACQCPAAPEADPQLLRGMETASIGWVRRPADEAVPVRTFGADVR